MLKIILSVTGAGLIALGIFGGSPLGNLFSQFGAKSDQTPQPEIAQANVQQVEVAAISDVVTNSDAVTISDVVTNNDQVTNNEVVILSDVVIDNGQINSSDELTNPIVSKTAVVSGVTTSGNVVTAEATTGVVNVAVAQGANVEFVATDTLVAVDGQALEVSSNVASSLSTVAAANAADSAAVLKSVAALEVNTGDQSKSTDRNAQVALAQTSLASSNDDNVVSIPSAGIGFDDKKQELGQVLEVSTGQSDNEMLVVMKDKVNMRGGPSIGHAIVLTLDQGQELMEFKREGKWVHVGAYGTSGQIGWVHEGLVGPNQ